MMKAQILVRCQSFAHPGVPCLVLSIYQKHPLSNKSMLSCHCISKTETHLCYFQILTPCHRVPRTSQDTFLWITITPECAELVSRNPGPYPDKKL